MMLIPKENLKRIYQSLFQEGVMVAKKDYNAPKHQDIDVPNLQVIKALQSLDSRGYVKTQFSWQYYYYYLTNEGIEYLREYLHLPPDVIPRTFVKTTKAPGARPGRGKCFDLNQLQRLTTFKGDGDRDRPYRPPRADGERDYRRRDGEKKEGASGDWKPEFKGGVGRGAPRA
ncbi:Plectin/S10 domain-containing protein [Cladochytrium replicatum]|nr:Plectin/S10 domain-containing protein [Cladochytrium replicatum]